VFSQGEVYSVILGEEGHVWWERDEKDEAVGDLGRGGGNLGNEIKDFSFLSKKESTLHNLPWEKARLEENPSYRMS